MMKKIIAFIIVLSGTMSCFMGLLAGGDELRFELQDCLVSEVKKDSPWSEVCKLAEKTVCQIFCYNLTPNFSEPYLQPTRSGGALGSGFLISIDGERYILTNYHVVDSAVAIAVQFPGAGRDRYRVEFIGGCPDYDVALLKLTDESLALLLKKLGIDELPYLELGDSDEVSSGEKLLAAGYPMGFETMKIVFGVCSGREELAGGKIQTTLPINHGNSGGPAFNKKKEVVGITSSGVDKSVFHTEGLNFIIPSNNIKALLSVLLEHSVVRVPHWGISVVDVTPNTLKYLDCDDDKGVLVSRVRKLSLFEKAGLRKGDVLLALNGLPVDHHGYVKIEASNLLTTMHNYLRRLEIGSTLTISYFRDGREHNAIVEIEQAPVLAIDEWVHWSQPLPDYDMIGGMVFSQLSMNFVKDYLTTGFAGINLQDGRHIGTLFKYVKLKNLLKPRVCVSACLPNSQAYQALNRLLRSGDCVVKEINGEKIETIDDVREAILEAADSEHIVVESEGGIVVALPIEDILREEEFLASQYGYEPSGLYRALVEARQVLQEADVQVADEEDDNGDDEDESDD